MKTNLTTILRAAKLAMLGFLSWKLWERFRITGNDIKNAQNHQSENEKGTQD